MSNGVILSLETATLGGSVYLGRGGMRLAVRQGDPKVSHSNSLLSDINDCLDEARLTLDEVELFACASGPGSFTGLRIGIATLKALAATLDRPCIGVPTLAAIAHAAGPSEATVALLPAGRGEVFAQLFSVSTSGEVKALDRAGHLSPKRLMDRYETTPRLNWAGNAVVLHKELLRERAAAQATPFYELGENLDSASLGWFLLPQTENLAEHVATLALQSFQNGNTGTPASLAAIYVRPSDAELKEQCR